VLRHDPSLHPGAGISAQDRIGVTALMTYPSSVDWLSKQMRLLRPLEHVDRAGIWHVLERRSYPRRTRQDRVVDAIPVLHLPLVTLLLHRRLIGMPGVNQQVPLLNDAFLESIFMRLPRLPEKDQRQIQANSAQQMQQGHAVLAA